MHDEQPQAEGLGLLHEFSLVSGRLRAGLGGAVFCNRREVAAGQPDGRDTKSDIRREAAYGLWE
ncbi:MAG TPA: hypothetical protein VD810_06530 [Methylophilaceae bacterium]|nr:hypothetical protein [Methylophilaceae bacterium]